MFGKNYDRKFQHPGDSRGFQGVRDMVFISWRLPDDPGGITCMAMATYSFNRLIMGKVEIGNFYCLIGDNRILFLQKCLLNSSPLL